MEEFKKLVESTKVIVYNGQLDILVNLAGIQLFLDSIEWNSTLS